jgi:biopolymer transport protein ExbD
MFRFGTYRRPRRASLTPMIDVVFLLLVFFMLASQFGQTKALPLLPTGAATAYSGPPRLVEVSAQGLALNGASVLPDALLARLAALTESPEDIIVLRPQAGTDLQRLIDVAGLLSDAGFTRLAVVE